MKNFELFSTLWHTFGNLLEFFETKPQNSVFFLIYGHSA